MMDDYPMADDRDQQEFAEDEMRQLQTEREEQTLAMLLAIKRKDRIAPESIDYLAGELGLASAWEKYQAPRPRQGTRHA